MWRGRASTWDCRRCGSLRRARPIVGHGVEQSLPDPGLRPVAEAREYAVRVAQQGRQITPRAAGSGDPQDRLNKSSVVLAAAAGVAPLAKTKRLHLRPLGVSQNESVHSKLESQSSTDENPKSQQTLGLAARAEVGILPSANQSPRKC